MDVYTQAVAPAKHAAQAAVLALFFPMKTLTTIQSSERHSHVHLRVQKGRRDVAFCTLECQAKITVSCRF
jgi:hypothetical protein